MRALLRFSAGTVAALLATAYIVASAESGMSAFQPSVVEAAAAKQTVVNRVNKGDREIRAGSTAQTRPAVLAKEPKILEGCDPAFSPLTSPAKRNFANRCLS